jgi:hypothetical protein
VKPEVAAGSSCSKGFHPYVWKGHTFCLALSSCPAADGDCAVVYQHLMNGADWKLEDGWPHDPDRGYYDAYCRRGPDTERPFAGDAGTWVWNGWCAPKACAPAPSPSPTPAPSPSGEFACNSEGVVWEPVATCPRVTRVSVGLFYFNRDGVIVNAGGKGKTQATGRVGDKVLMNSSPKYDDPRCTRGALIPGNCVEALYARKAEWSISPDIGIKRDDGDNALGFLASWKPSAPGTYTVQMCLEGKCASTEVVIE